MSHRDRTDPFDATLPAVLSCAGMYTTLKFVHVLAAIVWLGSGFSLLLLTSRMVRTRDYTGATALAVTLPPDARRPHVDVDEDQDPSAGG